MTDDELMEHCRAEADRLVEWVPNRESFAQGLFAFAKSGALSLNEHALPRALPPPQARSWLVALWHWFSRFRARLA